MKTATLTRKRFAVKALPRAKIDIVVSGPLKIRKVLVPTDFSPASLEAIDCVLPWLREFGAELHLTHVIPPEYPFSTLADLPIVAPDSMAAARVRCDLRLVAHEHARKLTAHVHAQRGRPFEEICRLARKIDIDLVAIATHGYTGLKHFALGSTAEGVIRYSPCPVLVVRSTHQRNNGASNGELPQPALHIQKILVPVDFSECSNIAIEYAKNLAMKSRASLIFVHSVYFQYHVTSAEYARYDYPLCVQEADKGAHEQMRELVRVHQADGVKIEPLLATGHAGEQICSRARSHDADLIVTSTHGWTGFKHVLIGSTAEYVVRHASSPVLVVPTHDRPGTPAAGNYSRR